MPPRSPEPIRQPSEPSIPQSPTRETHFASAINDGHSPAKNVLVSSELRQLSTEIILLDLTQTEALAQAQRAVEEAHFNETMATTLHYQSRAPSLIPAGFALIAYRTTPDLAQSQVGRQAVGYLLVGSPQEPNQSREISLMVNHSVRRQGVGSQLVDQLIELGYQNGWTYLHCLHQPGNDAIQNALRQYRDRGYITYQTRYQPDLGLYRTTIELLEANRFLTLFFATLPQLVELQREWLETVPALLASKKQPKAIITGLRGELHELRGELKAGLVERDKIIGELTDVLNYFSYLIHNLEDSNQASLVDMYRALADQAHQLSAVVPTTQDRQPDDEQTASLDEALEQLDAMDNTIKQVELTAITTATTNSAASANSAATINSAELFRPYLLEATQHALELTRILMSRLNFHFSDIIEYCTYVMTKRNPEKYPARLFQDHDLPLKIVENLLRECAADYAHNMNDDNNPGNDIY